MAARGAIRITLDLATEAASRALNRFTGGVSGVSERTSSAFKQVGVSMAAAGTAGVAAITKMVSVTASFEQGMAEVGAISGASADDMQRLTDKAKELGASTIFSASEAADALKYMAMAGWDAEKSIAGIDGVLSLAAASGEDLGMVADIVTDGLSAFGLAAQDAGRFSDVLAAASSGANTNVAMLGESFKYVGPVAGALGYSIEDVSVALGIMANSGVKASQAGTSLRSAMTNLAKPTKQMQKSMDALGIEITDSNGNMKSWATIMEDLRSKFKNLTPDMKAAQAAAIFGKEAMAGMLAIIDAPDDDFKKLTKSINESSGAAEDMSNKMQDTLAGSMKALGSAIEAIQISFGEMLVPVIRLAANFLTKLATAINAIPAPIKKFIAYAGGISTVFLVVGGALATFIGFLPVLMTGLASLKIVIAAVLSPFSLVAAAVVAIGAAITYFTVKSVGLKNIMGTISSKAEEVKSRVSSAFKGISESVGNVAKSAYDTVKTHFGNVQKFITMTFDNLKKKVFPEGGGAFKEFADRVINSIGDIIGNLGVYASKIAEFFVGITNALKSDKFASFLKTLSDMLSSILAPAFRVVSGAVTLFLGFLKRLTSMEVGFGSGGFLGNMVFVLSVQLPKVFNSVLTLLTAVGKAISTVFSSFSKAFGGNQGGFDTAAVLGNLIDVLMFLLTDVLPGVIIVLTEIITFVANVASVIITVLTPALTFLASLIGGVVSTVIGILKHALYIITDLFMAPFDILDAFMRKGFSGAGEVILEILGNIGYSIVSLLYLIFVKPFENIFKAVVDTIVSIFPSLGNILDGTFSGMLKPILNFASKVGEFFSGSWKSYVDSFKKGWEDIKFLVSSSVRIVTNLFGSMVDVIAPILSQVWGVIKGFVEGFLKIITNVGLFIIGAWYYIFYGIYKVTSTVLGKVWDVISTVFTSIYEFISGVFESIMAVVTPFVTSLWETLSGAFNQIWGMVVTVFSAIRDFAVNIFTEIWTVIQGWLTSIADTFMHYFTIISEVTSTAWQYIKDAFTTSFTFISEIVSTMWSYISGLFSNAYGFLSNIVLNLWTVISQYFSQIKDSVVSRITEMWNSVKSWFSEGFNNISSVANSIWEVIVRVFTQMKDDAIAKVKELISGMFTEAMKGPSQMVSAGQDIVSGMISGIKNMTSGAINAITGVVNGVINKAKSLLGINSPSRLFMEFGSWTSEGLAIGIEDEGDSAISAMDSIIQDVSALGSNLGLDVGSIRGSVESAVQADVNARLEDEGKEGPKKVTLQVGDAEFEAYLTETVTYNQNMDSWRRS